MASIPRILTVDSSWTIARIVRAAVDLTDRTVIQVDIPSGDEALEEIGRVPYHALITALQIDGSMKGFELALRARQVAPDTAVIILADVADLEDLDEETRADSPFIYMRRPVDVQQFMQVMIAALEGEDVFAAFNNQHSTGETAAPHLGVIPALDPAIARSVIDRLLTDVGAMAIVLSTRDGEILIESGAVGYLDRERLTDSLAPTVHTNIAMHGLVGGKSATLHFFDGDDYDVFVLSVGFHHFLSIIFDGQFGARQFGAVTRFGRRAAEDLKALLGASAYLIEQPAPVKETARRKTATQPAVQVEEDFTPLAKAEKWDDEEEIVEPEEAFQLAPIEDFDPSIFDRVKADVSLADDLFNLEKMEELASETRVGHGALTYEEAKQMGLIP